MSPTSPALQGAAPTGDAHEAFASYERIITGYTHYDFPDLSTRRFAPDTYHTVSLPSVLRLEPDTPNFIGLLAAAVARVLGAYCGCQDVLLGIADDQGNRLLPVRVEWSSDRTWGQVATNVEEALADPRWPRIHPDILKTALDLAPKQSPALGLLSARPLPENTQLAESSPLRIAIDSDNSSIAVTASERYCHPSQSRVFLSQVTLLVEHASANPELPLSTLPQLPSDLLSSHEKRTFEERCKINRFVPPVTYAADYLTLQAKERPDDVAVRWYADLSTEVPITSFSPETISNIGLEHRANQVGRWLLQIGLEKGRSVAVCMKRDVLFHAVFIGIQRAGGCYVPIDAELPIERQQFIIKDSNAQFVLSTSDIPCFPTLGELATDVSHSGVQQAISAQSSEALMIPDLDDLAYILYTSGTTGTPKGCLLTHRGLGEAIWCLSQLCAAATLEPSERLNYLCVASVAFDVHIAEIMVPLAVGIPILVAPRSLLLEDLPYYVKHLGVSHVGIVPSLIEATMGAAQEDEDAGEGTTLRYIASGGEKMSDAILDRWASHPKIRLANFYGPSEVTIGCASRMMDQDTPRANIGHVFASVGAYVVDENLNIVLRGGTGELVVEGPLVGRGYVGRPDLTAKVFLKFPDDGSERWAYRTGDLVRMMPDATLEIIGRIDTQIKLRGVRIESEGISSILRNAGAPRHVLDVMTILTKHPAIGIEQIVSFVAWNPSVPVSRRKGGTPSLVQPPEGLLRTLRAASDRELASYMRPSHIVPLDFIPLSSNGKADAKVLNSFFLGLDMEALAGLMTGSSAATSAGVREESTETEQKVIDMLGPYIKMPVDHLGPATNLFECGMDSLAVARFVADLRRAFETNITPAKVMQIPTVCEIAALLEDGPASSPASDKETSSVRQFAEAVRDEVEATYPPNSIAAILPPLPVQEGVLFRSANAPTMYVQHVLVRLSAEVEHSRMHEAWKEVVAQHEMLRTVFHFGNKLVQVVLRPDAATARLVQRQNDAVDDSSFRQSFTAQAAAPVARELNTDISQVPPVQLSWFTADHDVPTYMVLSIHHALYDGISLPVLLQDLERAYMRQSQLPSASLSSVLEQTALVDEDAAKAFWSSYFQDYPWQHLLNQTASSPTADVTSRPFSVSLKELQAKAATKHVTLQALLMCAYATLLAQHIYDSDDIVFGVIRAGRSVPVDNIDTTLCPMITVVPARVRLSDPRNTLRSVQEDNARVGEYEHIPLSRIQKWIADREGSLFDTLFSVSFKEDGTSRLWNVIESQNPEPDYILAIEIVLDLEQDQAVVHAAYTPSDISSSVVDAIVSHLEEVALQIVESAEWSVPRTRADRPAMPARHSSTNQDLPDVIKIEDVDPSVVTGICTLAAQFLRVEPSYVKADTSLLSLGLDSIKSVGLSRKLSGQGLSLSSADILKLSTPVRMAAYIQRSTSQQQPEERLSDAEFIAECKRLTDAMDLNTVKLSDDDEVQVFPISVLQAGMLSQTLSSQGRLYVHMFPLHLHQGVDVGRVRDAWTKAIATFPILRTSFHFLPVLGSWAQAVHSATFMDWSESQDDTTANLVETLNPYLKLVDESAFNPPPVFLRLLRNNDPDATPRLILILHHALYDGLSIANLLHTVEQLYREEDVAVSEEYYRLLPRILWQEKNGTSFWVKGLRDLRNAPIPRKVSNPADKSTVHHLSAPIRLTQEDIRNACRSALVTPQCLGQTAFAKLLAVLTGSRDVLFGRVVSGRDVPGSEDVIGPMLNTVPCRILLEEDLSNETLLKRVQDANVASMAWQHASLRSIQRELGVSNLWDSLFVYQPRQESLDTARDAPWAFDAGDIQDISIHYPLNLELHETDDGFVVQAACMSDVADETGLRELVDRYVDILSSTAHHLDESWRRGLPEVETGPLAHQNSHSNSEETETADWDSRTEAFREILSTTTKVPSSKIHTGMHLAALGVDSISAVQIVSRARRAGFRITASEVIQSRTVGHLLTKLKELRAQKTNGHIGGTDIDVPRKLWPTLLPPQIVESVERITVASPGMEWMAGMWQRSKGSRFQHVFGYYLPPDVDVDKLQNAWNQLLRRHAILRSTFVYDDNAGAPRVVVFKAESMGSSWSLESMDTSKHILGAVERRMKDVVSSPPSIERPFTRAIFLQSPRANHLLIHLHHFQYDAWSLQLLIDDLSRLYAGEEPTSLNDMDAFLRFSSSSVDNEQEQEEYWQNALSDSVALFPSLSRTSSAGGRDVYTHRAAISGASRLDQRARDLTISLQSVFLACWARVQARRSATDNPVFSLWHSGRTGDLDNLERLAIPCINVLPLCVPGAQLGDPLEIARQIQGDLQSRSAVVEQSRLVKVHEWVGREDKPLSNVFVNIVKIAPDLEKSGRGLLKPIDVPYHIPEVPENATAGITRMHVTELAQDDIMVDIVMLEDADQIVMSIEFSEAVSDKHTAKAMLEEWATLVKDTLNDGKKQEVICCVCM